MVAQFSSDSNDNANVPQTPETPTPQAIGDNGFTLGQPLSPQPSLQESIDWLLTLRLSPLPVAPIQPDNSKFTGKNPSYLDAKNKPHLVSHKPFQTRQPNASELKKWFANPLNGVGALGSEKWAFIDLDRHKFNSEELTEEQAQEACDAAAQTLIANIVAKTQKLPPYERTQSGGWRIVIGLSKSANFTNFCLTPGGDHVGEVLKVGRYAVMAPSVGPTGQPYVAYHRCAPEEIPVVDELEEIGLYPTGAKAKSKSPPTLISTDTPSASLSTDSTVAAEVPASTSASSTPTPTPTSTPSVPTPNETLTGAVRLEDLASNKARKVLSGTGVYKDKSGALTLAIKEFCGWENWLREHNTAYMGKTLELAAEAAAKLGIDSDRVPRILKTIDPHSCRPAIEEKGGEEACRAKVKWLQAGGKRSERKANAKVIPLPTATPLPKAVGGSDNSPPLPPNYGGGSGGFDPNDEDDWRSPIVRNGKLGYWVFPKKKDKAPYFDIKTNFDFVVVKELERYKVDEGQITPDGGDLQLKITRASDSKTRTVLISAEEYGTAKTFTAALNKRFGGGIICRLSDYDLNAIRETKTLEYQAKGGKTYKLASVVGRQPDGTRVFPNLQLDTNGMPLTEEESMWVFNPHIGELNYIPAPNIPKEENPNALRELIEAQRDFAQANLMRFLLVNGWNAACVNEQEIMRHEDFMPVMNLFGDVGTGKTIAAAAGISPVWGDSGKGMISSASVPMAYERLAKTGSIPCVWDDPPSKSKKDQDALDEFVKRQYNKHPRTVMGNVQKPLSSMGITSNHCVGETLPATASRIVGVFFPKVRLNKVAYPRLRKAMAQAPGAFRSLLTIGYNQMAVYETRDRLIPHLQHAHERAADNWALIVWYTQKVVELAGLDINVERWVIEHICPTLNEDMAGLDSASDFIKRLQALHTQNRAGTWNVSVVTNRSHGKCLALELNTLWDELAKVDPPAYNKKVLEAVLVNKGCVKGVTTKFDSDRDSVQTYRRELIKGVNEGLNWIPPKPPQKVSKRALLIPERLWEEFDFHPNALPPDPDDNPTPPTPPSTDNAQWDAWDEGDVQASSYAPVTPSYVQLRQNVTSSNADVEGALGSSLTPSYVVTQKELEKREREESVEEVNAQEKTDDATNATDNFQTSKDASEKSVPLYVDSNPTPETSSPQGVELVTIGRNLDVTGGGENVTSPKTDAQTQALTPDDNLIKLGEVAHEMIQCTTPSDVETLYAKFPQDLIHAAKKDLGDKERLRFEAIASQWVNPSPTAAEVVQSPAQTPKVEAITPAAQTNKDASPSDAELVAEAKRQGKVVFRYVGEMRTWGVNSLAHNVLVERLGKDRFGLLVSVQRLGEKWAQPIDVCPKLLEEI